MKPDTHFLHTVLDKKPEKLYILGQLRQSLAAKYRMGEKNMESASAESKNGSRLRSMLSVAVMTAVICVLAPLSLPVGPVPVSLATLALYFAIYILGWKKALLATALYLLLGLAGAPVFSAYTGGAACFAGATGGYLVGYLPLVLVGGLAVSRWQEKLLPSLLGLVFGTAVLYGVGTLWLARLAHLSFGAALLKGVVPFLFGDACKIAAAAFLGPKIRKALVKARVL